MAGQFDIYHGQSDPSVVQFSNKPVQYYSSPKRLDIGQPPFSVSRAFNIAMHAPVIICQLELAVGEIFNLA